jgi:hypothetical protein
VKTRIEKSSQKIRDLELGEITWVPETKTGLLVQVEIVHKFHVPGKYTDQINTYESDPDKIVWAKQDLGNGHFSWYALYADAEVSVAPDGIVPVDKFTSNNKFNLLKTPSDDTSEFIKRIY